MYHFKEFHTVKFTISQWSLKFHKVFITLLFHTSLFIPLVNGQSPELVYAKNITGSGSSIVWDKCYDSDSNIYMIGDFGGTVDFNPLNGGHNLTSEQNTPDIYVAKYTNDSRLLWIFNIGGKGNEYGRSIDIDSNDNLYVSGSYTDTCFFDSSKTVSLKATFFARAFMAKYDSSGKYIWAKSLEAQGASEIITDIRVHTKGGFIITGYFYQKTDFDPSTDTAFVKPILYSPSSAPFSDVFIAKYSASGIFEWVKSMGGVGDDFGYGVCLDDSGYTYITGNYHGTCDFDPGPDTFLLAGSTSGDNMYVGKYDTLGNMKWVFGIKSNNFGNESWDIESDVAGNILIAGEIVGSADFDPSIDTVQITSFGTSSGFIAKYKSTGHSIWAKSIPNTNDVYEIEIDDSCNLYIAGAPNFIAKYDSSGSKIWATKLSGNMPVYNNGTCRTILPAENGGALVTGYFSGYGDFDPLRDTFLLFGGPGIDAFIAKYRKCIKPNRPLLSSLSSTICEGDTINIIGNGIGNISWYTDSIGGNFLVSDTLFKTDTLSSGQYYFYVQDSTCVESERQEVYVDVLSLPQLNNIATDSVCDSGMVALSVSGLNGDVTWYKDSMLIDSIGSGNSFSAFILSDTAFYVIAQNSMCSSDTVQFVALANPTPQFISASNDSVCGRGLATLNSVWDSGIVMWYDSLFGVNVINTGPTYVTDTIDSTTIYYASSSNHGCVSNRIQLTAFLLDIPIATISLVGKNLKAPGGMFSYQWINCSSNDLIQSETDSIYQVVKNGYYAVIISKSGCVDTSECFEYNFLGFDDNSLTKDIIIYPNPTIDQITIESTSFEYPVLINVYNQQGQMVATKEFKKNENIDFSLPDINGQYIIEVIDGTSKGNFKVIKK